MKKAIIFLFLMAGVGAMANNLQINNVALTDNDPVAKTVMIRFDISWEHSWRDEINWDAAWVFAKFFDGELPYHHCKLSLDGSLYGTGTPHELIVPNDSLQLEGVYYGVGAFIYRNALSDGAFDADSVMLKWNYGLNGVETLPADIEVHVYGTEMVYIPEGPFAFGDGNGINYNGWRLKDSPDYVYVGDYLSPKFSISGPMELRVHGIQGLDWDGDGDIDNPYFPTGYKAFYIMKYETTQGQYTDFLNSLTDYQIASSDLYPNTSNNRFTITIQNGKYVCPRPDRSCNYLTSNRPMSLVDWMGLRPLTEMEYEKACHGILSPIYGSYAWGTTSSFLMTGVTGDENGTELSSPDYANLINPDVYGLNGGDGGRGPRRAGIFARQNSNRISSGAGYYGVMELSGNLGECMLTMWNQEHKGFISSHGNGEVNYDGLSDSFSYLNYDHNTYNLTYLDRGRFMLSSAPESTYEEYLGARFVRNAPILP